MATFYTDVADIQNDPLQTSNKRTSGRGVTAGLVMARTFYTTDGTEDNGDILRIVKLPAGVEIDPVQSYIYTNATLDASAVTVDIGDDSSWSHITPDPDRYADGVDITTAKERVFFCGFGPSNDVIAGTAPAALLTPYVTTKDGWLEAVLTTSSTLTASVDLLFGVVYRVIG